MYRPVLVTPPASTPVSIVEVKKHVAAPDTGEDDALLTALIDAAVSHLDGWSGILARCLITQTWRQDFDAFSRCLRLPLFPVASIASVKYDDAADVEQTVSAADYVLLTDDLGAFVRFDDDFAFPAVHEQPPAVRVAYVAGEASAPAAVEQAILLLVGHWYANREAVVVASSVTAMPLPFAVDALLAPFRRPRF